MVDINKMIDIDKIKTFISDIFNFKKKAIFWSIFISIIIFLLSWYTQHKLDEISENVKLKPDIEIEMSPFLYDGTFGEYLPLIITNTGDYTFENVDILISTCVMLEQNYYEYYRLPLLASKSQREIPFANNETINEFKRKSCYPFSKGKYNEPIVSISFNPFNLTQEKSAVGLLCNICPFNTIIIAEYKEDDDVKIFRKNISSYFDFPAEINFSIGP